MDLDLALANTLHEKGVKNRAARKAKKEAGGTKSKRKRQEGAAGAANGGKRRKCTQEGGGKEDTVAKGKYAPKQEEEEESEEEETRTPSAMDSDDTDSDGDSTDSERDDGDDIDVISEELQNELDLEEGHIGTIRGTTDPGVPGGGLRGAALRRRRDADPLYVDAVSTYKVEIQKGDPQELADLN